MNEEKLFAVKTSFKWISKSVDIFEGLQEIVKHPTFSPSGSITLRIQTWPCKTMQEVTSIDLITG